MKRTIVITGANRGIGLELARQARARGAQVIATARRPAEARELARRDLRVEQLEVTDAASVARFARALGKQPVDLLINNAGIGVAHSPLEQLDVESLIPFFQVNTLGPLRVTQALLPNLRAGREKKLVHMTSLMGSIADNTSGDAYAYRASKAALNIIAKSMSIDLAPEGFICVVAHPGWVRTDMGGADAPLSVEVSAAGLLRVIDGLGPEHNGKFLGHEGDELPW
jgi:NAD(P)-dependent dehydrogenase (short-subunit alcohol dehydrogenase family)